MNTGLAKTTVTLLAIISLLVQSVSAGVLSCSCRDDSQQVNSCCDSSASHSIEDISKSDSSCQKNSVSCCSSGRCCCSENQPDSQSGAFCQCDGGGSDEQPLAATGNSELTAENLELITFSAIHYLDSRPAEHSSHCFTDQNYSEFDSPSLQTLLCIWQT
ncbi:MAG: hypothetical protein COA78_14040 [Blastopirellula sp.]|nr:MAG: hypothetical protein COA78_14040 [Blastopirellula sp.]